MGQLRVIQGLRLAITQRELKVDQPEEVPQSKVVRTVVVLILMPAAMAMVGGGIVGYSINGVPGAIGAGLFFGFAAVFAGAFLYWLVGPIETPSWPTMVVALVVVTAMLVLLLV